MKYSTYSVTFGALNFSEVRECGPTNFDNKLPRKQSDRPCRRLGRHTPPDVCQQRDFILVRITYRALKKYLILGG